MAEDVKEESVASNDESDQAASDGSLSNTVNSRFILLNVLLFSRDTALCRGFNMSLRQGRRIQTFHAATSELCGRHEPAGFNCHLHPDADCCVGTDADRRILSPAEDGDLCC